jgi:prevent-host-death family protein
MCYSFSMSKTINQRDLRNFSAKVLREVQAGQIITVTRNGEPVAELRPVQARRFASRGAIAEAAAHAARIDAKRFRDDVDATVNQSVDG